MASAAGATVATTGAIAADARCSAVTQSRLAVSMKTTLLETDSYVSSVAPLAHDPDVQNAIADSGHRPSRRRSLAGRPHHRPTTENAKFLEPKISGALASVAHDATLRLVRSDQGRPTFDALCPCGSGRKAKLCHQRK